MKIYYFSDTDWEDQLNFDRAELSEIFNQIANGTVTDDLVVVNYLFKKSSWSGGVAYARSWLKPQQFISRRGRWKFTERFTIPQDLPEKFKLIRLQFGMKNLNYPVCQLDRYGWKITYFSFIDHVAFLFAHELHHFRRYHLGLHNREGENSANQWALDRVRQFNYQVEAIKLSPQKRNSRWSRFANSRAIFDPYQKYRALNAGDNLLIKFDPHGHYQNEIVSVVRPIRKNSRRVVVATADGKLWRWPLDWVARVQ